MSKSTANRVDQQSCYILTSYPWKESSLWLEVFSRDYGRVPLLARSARKPNSVLRGSLMPFAPIELSWYGQNELRTLHTSSWVGGFPQPEGKNLLSGFYVNELMFKLTARDDANPVLFSEYEKIIQALCLNQAVFQALRLFEWQLLSLLGFAPDIICDEEQSIIDAKSQYLIQTESLPKRYNGGIVPNNSILVFGQSLIDLNNKIIESSQTRMDILSLNRFLLSFRLPDELSSRRILNQLARQASK